MPPKFGPFNPTKRSWAMRRSGEPFPPDEGLGGDIRLVNVRGPAQAMLNAGHGRQPTLGQHNWIPRGPRNFCGRMRALVVHPNDDRFMYAGLGLGGVFKSEDGGQTWFALFHDEPSLTIAGIAVHHTPATPIDQTTIWVATGEPIQNPMTFMVPGAGIFRSVDNGVNFAPAPVVTPAQIGGMTFIEAIAVDPTDATRVWVVGSAGAFRIHAPIGGPVTVEAFDAGTAYSDVAYGDALAAAGPPVGPRPYPVCLYLARAQTVQGDIVRIDDPLDTIANLTALLAGGTITSQPIPAGALPVVPLLGGPAVFPGMPMVRAKFTICRFTPAVMFVVYANAVGSGGYGGVYRTQVANQRPGFNTIHWDWVPIDLAFDLALDAGQGMYDLAIGVSPRNPEHLFVGYNQLYVSRDANHPIAGIAGVTWNKSINLGQAQHDPEQHPDFHVVAFQQQANPPAVFIASDGGIHRNTDYHDPTTTFQPFENTPNPVPPPLLNQTFAQYPLAPEPTHTWERWFYGVDGAQPFDVTTSPISPNLFGSGFVDNGTWFSAGGDTWHFFAFGDGGFMAFDAQDPYEMIGTHHVGIEQGNFPAAIEQTLPPTGTTLGAFALRRPILFTGFDPLDGPRFAADSLMHPRKPYVMVTTRQSRVYRSTDAENFTVLPIGEAVEIRLIFVNGGAAAIRQAFGIEFTDSAAGRALGLTGIQMGWMNIPGGGNAGVIRLGTGIPSPWRLTANDTLSFNIFTWRNGAAAAPAPTPVQVTFTSANVRDFNDVKVGEVAAAILAAIPAVPSMIINVFPCFVASPLSIELKTIATGFASSIQLDGTATTVLGVASGTYRGEPGRSASVTLQARTLNAAIASFGATPIGRIDLDGLTLRVGVDGAALTNVDLSDVALGNRHQPPGGRIAETIRTAAGAGLTAVPVMTRKAMALISTNGTFTMTGTVLDGLNDGISLYGPGFAGTFGVALIFPELWTFMNLSPIAGVDRRLTLTPPGGGGVVNVDFLAGDVNDQARVTPEELVRHVNSILLLTGIDPADLRCHLVSIPAYAEPTELAFATGSPLHLWAGGANGHVFRSTDDGASFSDVTSPAMMREDRSVEAIAVHPTNPLIAYVGHFGVGAAHALDSGMLWGTIDGGATWTATGRDIRATDGTLLSINAIEIDDAPPHDIYVATPSGVFASTDNGNSFAPFSDGLPNVVIMDLELERTTRTLRVALWGRGVWERRLDPAPVKDRRVFLRSNEQDQGFRPLVEGHDVGATTPRTMSITTSPDIKNTPFQHPRVSLVEAEVDGVEFDQLIVHEEPIEGASHLFVQVHNRGSFPATGVRVTAIWAETACGPPPLTAAFWDGIRAGAPVAPAPWTLIGSQVLPGDLVVGRPRIPRFDLAWPASIGDARELVILVAVHSVEDPLTTTEIDTNKVARDEPKVAVRFTETRRLADARQIHLAATDGGGFSIDAATTVGGALGFVTGPAVVHFARSTGGAAGVFNLNAVVPPRRLELVAAVGGQRVQVDFTNRNIPDLANATADQIRRAINRELTLRSFPARAIVGRADLSIGMSPTEDGARPLQLTSARHADLVVRGAAVAPAARAALFELIARLDPDSIQVNQINHFLVRVRNRGTAATGDITCRLFHLQFPVAAAPAAVANAVSATPIPPGGADVIDVEWNPGALGGVGPFITVLVTAEHAERDPIVLPAAGFADLDAVRAFCRTTNNAAYRVIPVA